MSIASEITRINTNIANSYTAISNKGGTLPATQNSNNLATAINSIPSGGSATLITKTITENGTYDATDDNADGYSQVLVNVIPSSKYIVTLENMHDESNDIENTYINSNNGNVVSYKGWTATDFIEINEKIVINTNIIDLQYCAAYDKDKNFIRSLKNGLNASLTSNVKYVRFSSQSINIRNLTVLSSDNMTDCVVPTIINEPLALDECNMNIESLIQILNNLADRTGQTAYKLTLGAANLEKLTAEQKAIATSKNWTLA